MRLCVPPLSETPSLPADKATNLQPSCETVDGVSTNLYAYDVFGNMTNEVQNGATIARTYDAFGRPTGYALGGFAPSREVHYAYDALGRFASVTAGGSGDVPRPLQTFAYSYLPSTDLVSGYTCGSFSRSVSYEPHRDLISAVTNAFNASTPSTISTFDYANDAAGRRISRYDIFDGAITTNLFGYNSRSEVTSAAMGTNTYGYAYDPIGNRIEASHNAETNSYTANNLNQYTVIDDFAPTYDADGNMTSDGRGWRYFWNGENRMVCASNAEVVVTYTYDHRGRMVRKVISRGGTETQRTQYTWDGWNIVREALITNPYSLTTNHYVWGLDVSNALQGAGGIGGLLAASLDGTGVLYCYDANGNVMQLVGTGGEPLAHYEYSPFGETVVSTGEFAVANHFRFSTKYWDGLTGLGNWGYRWYDPGNGRWMSRDPIGTLGSINEFGSQNNPIGLIDSLGLWFESIVSILNGEKDSDKCPNMKEFVMDKNVATIERWIAEASIISNPSVEGLVMSLFGKDDAAPVALAAVSSGDFRLWAEAATQFSADFIASLSLSALQGGGNLPSSVTDYLVQLGISQATSDALAQKLEKYDFTTPAASACKQAVHKLQISVLAMGQLAKHMDTLENNNRIMKRLCPCTFRKHGEKYRKTIKTWEKHVDEMEDVINNSKNEVVTKCGIGSFPEHPEGLDYYGLEHIEVEE